MKTLDTTKNAKRTAEVAQHTPGPWITDGKTRENHIEPPYCQVRAWHNGDSVPVKQVATVYYGENDSIRAANAHLIAAAPELYEALKEAAELLRPLVHAMNVRSHFHEKNVLANTIEKAIAKAEGK